MTEPREREAILRCQDGDLAGLEVLFELHRLAVLRTAYGIVENHHIAEESEFRRAIWSAVQSLSPKQRAAVVYHDG